MRYAETGFDLEVDLSRGNIDRVETDPELTELHLGGLGTSARILWDRVPPETEPFSEDNLLIFATGLLCGTAAPGCNRTVVSTFSPQTQLLAYSMMGGFWAPELKHAGYDKVIIRGKSPELVYLWINNDKVEIRDAAHLRGQGRDRNRRMHPPGTERARRPGRRHRPGRGEPGVLRLHRAGQVQRQPRRHRRGHGRQGPQGDRRARNQGHQRRPAGRVHGAVQRGAAVHQVPRGPPDSRAYPAILQGLGSPQEMAIADEQWHTTNFMWGNARTRRKDFWTQEIEEKWRKTQENVRTRLISCYNCPMKCGRPSPCRGSRPT